MHKFHIDFETRSTVDLKKTGMHVYAAHQTTDVWCAAYSVDDGEIKLWVMGEPVPREALQAVEEGWLLVAHNAAFERTIWRLILTPRYGWPEPKLQQWRCTMAMALAMSLPASLANCAAALGLKARKDMKGRRLMLQMAKPRKPRKGENPDGLFWWDDEGRRHRLYAYCIQDVRAEREVEKRVRPLSAPEQEIQFLDQTINDRGVAVDTELCYAALNVIGDVTSALNIELEILTDGEVSAATNVTQLHGWLVRQGINPPSLDKEAIDELLADLSLKGIPRRALEIRHEAAKGSVSKVKALLNGRDEDGRARGLLQFHAASTGRWAGRRFQPQNLKRPSLEDVGSAIDLLAFGEADILAMAYGEPLAVVGDCLRGMLVAPEGRDLIAADFANIEGRVLAWFAGEDWKLDAFRAYDAGTGPDLYKLAVAALYGMRVGAVTKEQRQQIGKVLELASGYEGGHGAYLKFNIQDAFPVLVPAIRASAGADAMPPLGGETEWDRAWHRYDPRRSHGLTQEEWTTVRIVIDRWRAKHPATKSLWRDLDEAAIYAVRNPGKKVTVRGNVAFRVSGSFLWAQLPSGRLLCYPYPELRKVKTPWGSEREAVTFMGVSSYTHKWERSTAYGGLWTENFVQAISADVLRFAMLESETAGYPLVLTVHDELVAEIPKTFGSVEEFSAAVSQVPPWAEGLPIVVETWRGKRYRK